MNYKNNKISSLVLYQFAIVDSLYPIQLPSSYFLLSAARAPLLANNMPLCHAKPKGIGKISRASATVCPTGFCIFCLRHIARFASEY